LKPLGLFVFANRASYERYCNNSGNASFVRAAGFARPALGFAVTFAQPDLERIAIHEGAHLFHAFVYRSVMPSWYDEGFASTFGDMGTMRIVDGKLETRLPLDRAQLDALVRKNPPLADLLAGDALERLNSAEGADTFYAHSWALFNFLRNTKDPRFAQKFEQWEGFCLGAGYDKTAKRARSSELFDKVFAGAIPDLEKALRDWIAAQTSAK
jgi:hypothetical protein